MLNVILNGANGRMGRVINRLISEHDDMKVVAGVDISAQQLDDYPIYSSPADIREDADVVIDFSHFSAVPGIVSWCAEHKTPVVVATTALDDACQEALNTAAEVIPVFQSANMSLGVNALLKAVAAITPALEENFNVEIIEKHHNKKLDSPSGTAVMLADSIKEATGGRYGTYTYGRSDRREKRDPDEIGISSVRGGTIVGVHDVIFAGEDEMIEIRHTASSRAIFAKGAISAAKFLAQKGPGLYDMSDVIEAAV